jgi:hypothetical protein
VRLTDTLVLIGVAVAAMGCASAFPAVPTHPEAVLDRRYVSNSMTVGGVSKTLVVDTADGDATLSVLLGDNSLSFRACNGSGFNLWSINDGHLLVSAQEGWSLIACPPAADDQDHWFARFLDSRPAIAVTARGFTVTSGDTQIPFALVPSD